MQIGEQAYSGIVSAVVCYTQEKSLQAALLGIMLDSHHGSRQQCERWLKRNRHVGNRLAQECKRTEAHGQFYLKDTRLRVRAYEMLSSEELLHFGHRALLVFKTCQIE